jgi:uncharacterized protein YjbJ (UPF0337 family)
VNEGIWDRIKGNWKQLKGEAKKQWGEITDDEFLEMEGDRDKLAGRIQERYGRTRQEADREIDEWLRNVRR